MPTFPWHPTLNALLNAATFVQLLLAVAAIRRGDRVLHRRRMLGAVATSAVFLVSYGLRMLMSGTHRFPLEGTLKHVYLVILFSHMVLAVVLVPLVARTLWLGHRERFDHHRHWARWTWPIWIYVSFTGVAVYFLLFIIAPRLV